MLKSIWLLLLILKIVDGTTRLSLIDNAAYISGNSADVVSYTGSCDKCLCYAFFSNISSIYEAVNCYKNNNTCSLFENFISRSLIRINLNSSLFFKSSESSETTSESNIIHCNNKIIQDQNFSYLVVPTVTTSTFQCYQPNWNTTEIIIASGGSNLNQVNHPFGIFIAANSDILYIADSNNNRILKWLPGDTTGTLIAGGQGAGSNATQLSGPIEVCIDKNENVFVADSSNYRIQYFDHGSSIGRTIAGNGTRGSTNNLFGNIFGLGVDLADNVYVSDYDNARVTKWSPNATFGVLIAGTGVTGNSPSQLNIPTAFYVEPLTGTLYIPNQGTHCITKWLPGSSSGIVVAGTCGTSGSNETLLNNPACVTFDKYRNMYVADANNGRVIMFCPNSLIGIPIITSGLSNPLSIAVDTQLNLYVADWNHNRIVKYTLL